MNWARPRLSDGLADVVRGVTFSRGDTFTEPRAGTIAVLRAGNIGDHLITDANLVWVPSKFASSDQRLRPNDIVICTSSGSRSIVGKSAINKDGFDGTWGAFNAVVRAKPPLNPRFMFYWMQSAEFKDWRDRSATGANIQNIRYSELAALDVPLPAPSEQRRIVEILDQADALRKRAREADAKAARILPAVFLKMFGDPATNSMGWPTDRLDKLFNVVGGGTPAKSVTEYWAGDVPWASPKDMKVDVITHTEDHVTAEAIANSATKLVEKGSVLIVYRSGILAHTFPVAIAGRPLAMNQDLKALQSKGEVSNEFIYGWLITGQKLALSFVKKGATVHNIDGPRFLSLQVPKPPEELQERFACHLRELLGFKSARVHAAEQIERVFSLLLSRAFSGQLTAKWRAAHMQELLVEMHEQARLLNLPLPN